MTERSDAVEAAVRALRLRDRSAAEIDERLQARGVEPDERREVLGTLERVGYLDDVRYAEMRAATLAARGAGDALILDDLERRGLAAETIAAAIELLEPERERAELIVLARGATATTARYLASRGFDEDVVAAAVARGGEGPVD
ncbi:MAG: RecX family transcriptional regulator [Actinobacteria bacterium]|nr:RecX family transcriptional regulator [Actinomycetota bacterium]